MSGRRAAGTGVALALVLAGAAGWALRGSLAEAWSERIRPAVTGAAPSGSGGAGETTGTEPAPSRTAGSGTDAGRKGGIASDSGAAGTSTAGAAAGPDDEGEAGRTSAPGNDPEGAADGGETSLPGTGPDGSAGPISLDERLRRFFGPGGEELRLDSADLARIVARRGARPLPEGLSAPRVVARDSLLEASADVDFRRVLDQRLPALLRRMIGDSSRVTATVAPTVPEPGTLRLGVREVRAGSVGFPVAMIPWLLQQTGLPTSPDDPAAVEMRLGRGLTAARVEDGVVVLARRPAR